MRFFVTLEGGRGVSMSHDTYGSFEELQKHEVEGIDYEIVYKKRNPSETVIAIHGGEIEKMTSELAEKIAERLDATFYTFKGRKGFHNKKLHVTSAYFEEPYAISLVGQSHFTISVHGAWGEEMHTYVGGRDEVFIEIATKKLKEYGFVVEGAPDSIDGDHPNNIVNRNKRGKGLQLELTEAERSRFVTNDDQYSEFFWLYVKAISEAALSYRKEHEA